VDRQFSRLNLVIAGIVSSIAFSPDVSSGMFAVGTFKGGRISCYSDDTGDERIMELDLGDGGPKVDGQGITQVCSSSAVYRSKTHRRLSMISSLSIR
jgi:hypothetical protein